MRRIEFVNQLKTHDGSTDTRYLELELDGDGDLLIEASDRRGQSVILLLPADDVKLLLHWLLDMEDWPGDLRALVEMAGQSETWHSREPWQELYCDHGLLDDCLICR